MARKIRDAVHRPEDGRVVEIGPGTGKLTELLLEEYPDLVAYEVDERAVDYLRDEWPELDVRLRDVLEVDWAALGEEEGGPLSVVGNLPYQITSPILFTLIESMPPVAEALLMMQEEVAERITADPGGKIYGVTSVLVQLAARAELLFRVPPQVFVPPPSVTSAVVRLEARPHPALRDGGVSFDEVREVVRTAFNQRRKMLRNSLESIVARTGRTVPERWERARAEKLGPEEFVVLTEHLTEAGRHE